MIRDLSTVDTRTLVELAQGGDRAAFGEIYVRYARYISRYVDFRVRDRVLAEDLTAETFLRALRRIDGFRWGERDIGAWLVTIARNLIIDHFKSGRYRLEVTTGDVLNADTADHDTPEWLTLSYLSNVELLRAVTRLNPLQREAVTLRFLRELTVPETARIMRRSPQSVKSLTFRALRRLVTLLDTQPEPSPPIPPQPYPPWPRPRLSTLVGAR